MKRPVAILVSLAFTTLALAGEPALPANAFPSSSPKSPEEALATFELDPDFRIELVAAEPLITDPVAISFDENGALYVCEMRDYSERREEKLGRISRLEDRDADGRMDHATAFAEGLPWPTGVLCYDGGVFVMAAPDLWFFKDRDGDGVADERRVVLTGFSELAARLNVQQLPNSLRWGPDQRVHLAEGGNGSRVRRPDQKPDEGLVLRGRDLSFNPRTLELRAESGGGQYGMAFDDYGRKFVSSNSRHLMQIAYDVNLLGDSSLSLPPPAVDIAVDGPAAPVFRRSPDEAWRVIRTRWRVSGISPGLIEGGGVPSGYFTGATGVQIYRGDALPSDFMGNAFVADCGSNLVHRKLLLPTGVLNRAERPNGEERREFLTSADNWFRPVQIENGPSGGLYIVDLYREIIEHPWSLPLGIKEHLDLNRGNDRGRIWRIVARDRPVRRGVHLGDRSTEELVKLLGHVNGWHRDTAARLLTQRRDPSAVGPLVGRIRLEGPYSSTVPALEILAELGALDDAILLSAISNRIHGVSAHALQLAARFLPPGRWHDPAWRRVMLPDDSWKTEFSFHAALILATHEPSEAEARTVWNQLHPLSESDPWLRHALLAVGGGHAETLVALLMVGRELEGVPDTATYELMRLAVRRAPPAMIGKWFELESTKAQYELQTCLAAAVVAEGDLWRQLELTRAVQAQLAVLADVQLRTPGSIPAQQNWAIQSLVLTGEAQAWKSLAPAMASGLTGDLLVGAVDTLLRFDGTTAFTNLLDRWSVLPAVARDRLLASANDRAGRMDALLACAKARETFRDQVGPAYRNSLRTHRDPAVRARAIAIFGEAPGATSSEQAQHYGPSLNLPGDAIRGRAIYQIRCASCHRAAGEGVDLGPDLLTVAAAGRESLLANILEPNRELAPRFEAWTAKLKDGEEVSGVLSSERPESVSIRGAGGMEQIVARSNLSALASTGKSLMPEGLDEGLSVEAMADLLRFIESLAEPPGTESERGLR